MKNLGTSSSTLTAPSNGDLPPEQVTAGALRAAAAIVEQTCQQVGFGAFLKNPATIRELATLIDQQTGAPEMLGALVDISVFAEMQIDDICADIQEGGLNAISKMELARWQGVLSAIAKATGAA